MENNTHKNLMFLKWNIMSSGNVTFQQRCYICDIGVFTLLHSCKCKEEPSQYVLHMTYVTSTLIGCACNQWITELCVFFESM